MKGDMEMESSSQGHHKLALKDNLHIVTVKQKEISPKFYIKWLNVGLKMVKYTDRQLQNCDKTTRNCKMVLNK
jgi:hypothetical protein